MSAEWPHHKLRSLIASKKNFFFHIKIDRYHLNQNNRFKSYHFVHVNYYYTENNQD